MYDERRTLWLIETYAGDSAFPVISCSRLLISAIVDSLQDKRAQCMLDLDEVTESRDGHR